MRIALYHNLPSGGAKRVVYEHCRGLTTAGHEVVVYEPETAESEFCPLTEVASQVIQVPLTWPAGGSPLRTLANYNRLTATQERLARQLNAQGFDLLYVHHDLFETAPSLLRFATLPTVYFCQEPSRRSFEVPPVEGPPQPCPLPARTLWRRALPLRPAMQIPARYRLLNERTNTLAATLVLANSAFSCESILRAHGRRARRLTLGVDLGFYRPDDTPREPFILSVGGFALHKGFRFLVRSLAQVPVAQRPRLVLAGDREAPHERELLEKLAADLGVDLTVRLRVSEESLRTLYRRASLFVYAPYLEPLGLTPLEAMACETPVLGVREGGVRETVIEGVNGRLVDRDEAQFAAALQTLLAQPEELRQMGRQAREYVQQKWTWEQSLRELLSVFQTML